MQVTIQHRGPRLRRYRIALYSHDTVGLGHFRRNLLLAQTLQDSALDATILMISGARQACNFTLPPWTDSITLPEVGKNVDGHYESRRLDVLLQELVVLRSNIIRSALEAFEPDLLIVDNVPRGLRRELDASLEYLRMDGHCCCVLGLRDVLDDPQTVASEWQRLDNEDAIRYYYDEVWVYGDPTVYNLVREYQFSADVAEKVRFIGYLDQRMRLKYPNSESEQVLADLSLPYGELALCLLGGGEDGYRVAQAFLDAKLPPHMEGIILAGPLMPRQVQMELRQRAMGKPRLRVLSFLPEPVMLIQRADHVISMGGYNTVCEVLSFGKRALIVPRVQPRLEQWIRARRLRKLGMADVLHPTELNPSKLTEWLALPVRKMPLTSPKIDLNGLKRLPKLVEQLLDIRNDSARHLYRERGLRYVAD